MSKPNDDSSPDSTTKSGDKMPDGVDAPPPITTPKPDGLAEPNQQRSVNEERAKRNKKDKRGKKERRHPSDPYEPLKKKKGCGCGCGCLALILIILGLIGAGGYWLIAPFQTDYQLYEHKEQHLIVDEAPSSATTYIGNKIDYKAPQTDVDVAFIGGDVTLSGFFSEKVSFRGYKLTLTEDSVFAKGLEVYAVEFENNSQQIVGELEGRIVNQKNSP